MDTALLSPSPSLSVSLVQCCCCRRRCRLCRRHPRDSVTRDKRQTGDLVANRRSHTAIAAGRRRGRGQTAERRAGGGQCSPPHGRVRPAGLDGYRGAAAVGDLRLLWYLGTVTHSLARSLSLSATRAGSGQSGPGLFYIAQDRRGSDLVSHSLFLKTLVYLIKLHS